MKSKFRRTSVLLIAGFLMTTALSMLAAQQQQIRTPKQTPYPKNPDWSKLELDVLKVQGQVYLIAGAGGNQIDISFEIDQLPATALKWRRKRFSDEHDLGGRIIEHAQQCGCDETLGEGDGVEEGAFVAQDVVDCCCFGVMYVLWVT